MLKCVDWIVQWSKQLMIALVVISALYVVTVLYVIQLSGKSKSNITNVNAILKHVETRINSTEKYFDEVRALIYQHIREQGILEGGTATVSTDFSKANVNTPNTNIVNITHKNFTNHAIPTISNYDTNRLEPMFPRFAERPLQCYDIQKESLSDISDIKHPKTRSIFFLETSCRSHIKGRIAVTSRQACAVESAARMNPNLDVYLLFVSPGIIRYAGTESDKFLRVLLSYKNVKIHHLNFKRYLKGTPLENISEDEKLDWSAYPVTHASDVLRFITLWKYGGIYLDLDIITIRSLERLSPNFVVLETFGYSATGAIGFTATGDGQRLAEFCVNDLKNNFQGYSWNQNGPLVATRLVEDMCKTKITKNLLNKTCRGLKIYPPDMFYPIPGGYWSAYFNVSLNDVVLNRLSNSYGVHVWNILSEREQIDLKTSNVAYAILARKYCPKVFHKCKKFF